MRAAAQDAPSRGRMRLACHALRAAFDESNTALLIGTFPGGPNVRGPDNHCTHDWRLEAPYSNVHQRRIVRLVNRTPCLGQITISCPLPLTCMEALFSELSESRSLHSLAIHRCFLSLPNSLPKMLKSSISVLRQLDLSHCAFATNVLDLSRALSPNRTLQHLDLSGCKLQAGEFSALDHLFATLAAMPALQHLDLSCNLLGLDAEGPIPSSLPFGALLGNASLQHLNLSRNSLGRQHLADVFRALLAPGGSLRFLDLSCTDSLYQLPGPRYVDCADLGEALGINTSLTHLNLSNCGELKAEPLFSAFCSNRTLTHLDLSETSLTEGKQCCIALAGALRVNVGLRHLDLYRCSLGCSSRTFASVAEALGHNSALRHLNLRRNELGNTEIRALARALTINTTLKYLDLEDNPMGSAGCRALAAALTATSTLEHLGIDVLGSGRRALAALAAALDGHPSVKQLSVHYWLGATFQEDDIDSTSVLTKMLNRRGDFKVGDKESDSSESDDESSPSDNSE